MTTRRGEPFFTWGNFSWSDYHTTVLGEDSMSERSGRMDGQREREATLTRESVEDILWPLVEARVTVALGLVAEALGAPVQVTPIEECPDPRFDALRYSWFSDPDYGFLGVGSRLNTWPPGGPYAGEEDCRRVDASLGAIVRAAAACGRSEMEKVLAALLQWCDASQWDPLLLTPEEAAARALVEAWSDGKGASA